MTQERRKGQEEELSRAMVVVAHADDAEYGCSGTVAKWCSQGWEVVYVICTDGSKGGSEREVSQEHLASIRRDGNTQAISDRMTSFSEREEIVRTADHLARAKRYAGDSS